MCEVAQQQVIIQRADEDVKTLTLAVTGAVETAGTYLADYDSTGATKVTVKATTNDGDVTWTVLPVGVDVTTTATELTIALNKDSNVLKNGDLITVVAKTAHVTDKPALKFIIRPKITSLDIVEGHYVFEKSAGSWYALDLSGSGVNMSQIKGLLEVKTEPATANAYSQINWDGVNTVLSSYQEPGTTTDNPAKRSFSLPKGTVTASVWLKSAPDSTGAVKQTVEVQDPVTQATVKDNLAVQLKEFTFSGAGRFAVMQDKNAATKTLYDAKWSSGVTPPQGYAAEKNLTLKDPTIKVAAVPTEDVKVYLRATAYFPLANGKVVAVTKTGNVDVAKNAVINSTKKVADLDFGNVPKQVMYMDPFLVFWESSPDQTTWSPLQVSTNTVYITAAKPAYVAPLDGYTNDTYRLNDATLKSVCTYDSFLAISCQAILDFKDGSVTTADVREALAKAFSDSVNPNNRMKLLDREGTGVKTTLTYWLNNKPAQSINAAASIARGGNVFNNPFGSVACGAWADMLISMWALHGIGDGHKIAVDTNTALNAKAADAKAFLVRTWTFKVPPAVKEDDFSNKFPSEVTGRAIVPAQNNGASPSAFQNHFIAYDSTNKHYYDPSYGGDNATPLEWVNASTSGLFGKVATVKKVGFAKETAPASGLFTPNAKVVTFTDMVTDTVVYS